MKDILSNFKNLFKKEGQINIWISVNPSFCPITGFPTDRFFNWEDKLRAIQMVPRSLIIFPTIIQEQDILSQGKKITHYLMPISVAEDYNLI